MFTLDPLPYAADALEPHIDAQTMELHHDKHHQAYIDKVNEALKDFPELTEKSIEELLRDLDAIPETIRKIVQNHGGGHYNHSLFWPSLTPDAGEVPDDLGAALEEKFGGVEQLKKELTDKALTRFGSGWAWLVAGEEGFEVLSTANQDNPISQGKTPLLGVDVWEHAYYLKYQNRRAEYLEAWWNVVNWELVAERWHQAS